MKKTTVLTMMGFALSIGLSHAAETVAQPIPAPTLTPIPIGLEFRCELEGRSVGQGSGSGSGSESDNSSDHHQHNDVRCRVKGNLGCPTMRQGDRVCETKRSEIEIKCSNGFKLEDEYPAITLQGGDLWINANEHHKLATLRVRDFGAPAAEYERRFKADLYGTNSVIFSTEGSCRFEYPVPLN
jgi:hypothetical protein